MAKMPEMKVRVRIEHWPDWVWFAAVVQRSNEESTGIRRIHTMRAIIAISLIFAASCVARPSTSPHAGTLAMQRQAERASFVATTIGSSFLAATATAGVTGATLRIGALEDHRRTRISNGLLVSAAVSAIVAASLLAHGADAEAAAREWEILHAAELERIH